MRIKWDDGNEYPADRDPVNTSPIRLTVEFQVASQMKLADIDKVAQTDSLSLPIVFWYALHRAGIAVSWRKLCDHSFAWFAERIIQEESDTVDPRTGDTDHGPKEPTSDAVGRHAAPTSNA